MKNVLCLFVFAVMLVSCSADKNYEIATDSGNITATAARISSKVLFGGPIGAIDRLTGKMSLLKDQKSILKVYNSLLEKSGVHGTLTRVELDNFNDVYFLRGYASEYKSTMLLVKDDSGQLQSAGLTCTTTACSSTHGCEVKLDGTCSPCSGDCKKTTTVEGLDPGV